MGTAPFDDVTTLVFEGGDDPNANDTFIITPLYIAA